MCPSKIPSRWRRVFIELGARCLFFSIPVRRVTFWTLLWKLEGITFSSYPLMSASGAYVEIDFDSLYRHNYSIPFALGSRNDARRRFD